MISATIAREDVPPQFVAGTQTRTPEMFRPNPGPQERFLAWGGYEALFGGAAGPGKSMALLLDALYDVDRPDYRAILFRRSMPDLKRSLIDESHKIYPGLGALYNINDQQWTFPSGARIMFSHLEHLGDQERHRSAAYHFVGFDELTTFAESQYRYLTSRLRSSSGIKCRVRAATNPENDHWVKRRFAPWVDHEHPMPVPSGTTLWVTMGEDGRTETFHAFRPNEDALSRTFFSATLDDNPMITNARQYRAQLLALDAVSRKKLLGGDWDAKSSGGTLFKDEWFARVDASSWEAFRHTAARRVRAWDFASTSGAGDYSVGVLMAWYPKRSIPFVIEDVERLRGTPAEVHDAVRRCAESDGRQTTVVIPQESGQAGIDQVRNYARELVGFVLRTRKANIPGRNKGKRALGFSSQVEHRQVAIVRARWNDAFIGECVEFGEGRHDDQVDAASDAIEELSGVRAPVTEEDFAIDSPRRDESQRPGARSGIDFGRDDEDEAGAQGFRRRE